MPFATVRDLRMFYELRGAGPRLLGISGTGGDLRRFPTVFEMLPIQGFEILAYDQRGLGRTSRPDKAYTMADYADDANALIEALGWERCLVAGFSFGGMVAQKLALRHPHRVEPLVLASTSSGGAGGASFPLHELTALPLEEYIRRVISLSDTRRDAAWQAVHRVANCATQEEVDRLWEKLTEGEAIEQCGWLKDKYGVSWQIVPTVLGELMSNPDPEKTNRVMQALLQMKKIDINGLKEAFERG